MSIALGFPGNINFSGTITAPLFVSTQQIIAPVAAGTASTLTVGSLSSAFGSLSQAYTATLSVGTILNFNAGGSVGTNLMLSGTLTAGSISSLYGNISTLSIGTILNFLQGQTVSTSGTVAGTFLAGTVTCPGSFSLSGTLTSAAIVSGSLSSVFGSITQGYTSTLSVGTILNFSAGGSLGTNITLTGTLISASLSTIFSSITTLYSATITVGTILNLPGANAINFGSDQSKAMNAGNVGYQLSTPGSLDVYGAGAVIGNRNVKIWDNVVVAGSISINNISPAAYTLDVNGTISATGNVIAFNSTSDRRLKEDIQDLQNTGVIVDALRPVDFRWKKDIYHEPVRGKRDIGLIAQEVYNDFRLAHGTKIVLGESIETVDYLKFVPILLAEVKNVRQRIKLLENPSHDS